MLCGVVCAWGHGCCRCSETGTNFGIDIVSKHAMHAGGAEEVLYAGEPYVCTCAPQAQPQAGAAQQPPQTPESPRQLLHLAIWQQAGSLRHTSQCLDCYKHNDRRRCGAPAVLHIQLCKFDVVPGCCTSLLLIAWSVCCVPSAGEFCIMSCSAAADGYKLVLDNNSGTYSPHKAKLPLLQQLFTSNFPDMEVEVLDWRDPKLEYYHSLCPSRATAAAAQHASAAAAVAAAAAARGKGQQFVAG